MIRRGRIVALVVALATASACEPARPDVVHTAPPDTAVTASALPAAPAPLPVASSSGGADVQAEPPRKQELAVVEKDDNVLIEVDKDQRRAVVARVRFHRDVLWQHPLPEVPAVEAAVI